MFKEDAKKRSMESAIYFDQVDEDGELLWPSLTKQEFKEECDINNIMDRFLKTGRLDRFREFEGQYGDFSEVADYHDAQNQIIRANEAFMSLPANIRKEFDNDAGKFLAAVDNPQMYDKLVDLGIFENVPRKEEKSPTSESLDITGGTGPV